MFFKNNAKNLIFRKIIEENWICKLLVYICNLVKIDSEKLHIFRSSAFFGKNDCFPKKANFTEKVDVLHFLCSSAKHFYNKPFTDSLVNFAFNLKFFHQFGNAFIFVLICKFMAFFINFSVSVIRLWQLLQRTVEMFLHNIWYNSSFQSETRGIRPFWSSINKKQFITKMWDFGITLFVFF